MRVGLSVLCAVLSLSGIAALDAAPLPVATPTGATTDTIQGVKVADPYRWLENAADPKVEAWSDAQNARARDYLDRLSSRAAISAELTRLITAASPSYGDLNARGTRVFAMYNDPAKQQPMLVILNASADLASRKALVDPNALDAKGLTTIDLVCSVVRRQQDRSFAVAERQRGWHAAPL